MGVQQLLLSMSFACRNVHASMEMEVTSAGVDRLLTCFPLPHNPGCLEISVRKELFSPNVLAGGELWTVFPQSLPEGNHKEP